MLSDRLSFALGSGALSLPDEGPIAVVGAGGDEPLTDLPEERVRIVARHRPDNDAFARRGFDTRPDMGDGYAMTILHLPRAKEAQRHMIAEAARATGGPLVIDGAKAHGVEAMLKELRRRAEVGEVTSKSHGKLFTVTGGDFSDWLQGPKRLENGLITLPGVFSADGIDPGTAALAEALPPKMKGRVIDLGAGWGALAAAILSRDGVTALDLVEADHLALQAARRNVTDPRARFHWADATRFTPEEQADHVVTNPPFHKGRAAEPELGQAFITSAARMLRPKGALWLVANRHLPYERGLNDAFRTVNTTDAGAYKIVHATGPRAPSRRG